MTTLSSDLETMRKLVETQRIADRQSMRTIRLSPLRRAWNCLTGKRCK